MAQSKIIRIPVPTDVSGAPSLRPTGANPAIDVSAPFQGAQALAQGVGQLGTGLARAGAVLEDRERTADVAKADAEWLKSSLAIGNAFQADNDYATFDKRANADTLAARDKAAALINDPTARQAWLDQVDLKRISLVDAINDHGLELKQGADQQKLASSIDDLVKVYADPTTPEVTRGAARNSIESSIATALGSGLVTPAKAAELTRIGTEQADQALAFNRADLAIKFGDPQTVRNKLGIPSTADASGEGIVAAAMAANGGKLPDLDYSLAKVTAELIGDANFPTDPKAAKAYLSDPKMAGKYASAAAAMLNDRYKGDLTAVAVALDPEGGTVLADRWVASGHKEAVLPAAVRQRYRQTMIGYQPAVSGERIPIQAHPAVDLNNTDPAVLDRFEMLQSQFGEAVPIIPAMRNGEHNAAVGGADASQHLDGRSLELDVSKLSPERRAQLIDMASAMGFTGIGVYKDSMHLDTGPLAAWGSAGKTVPPYAKAAIDAHLGGTVKPPTLISAGVAPEYQALSFDQRMQLAAAADQALKTKSVDMQASLETIANNAPSAIANTGKYDGDLPTATQFVQAYGATDGIQRYRAFEASIDTSRTMFGFRTMPADQIMQQVAAAAPKSSGNDAELETKRFDAVSAAAEQTIKARAADPAGYVMNVDPSMSDAFTAAQQSKDPTAFSAFLSKMATWQKTLGIDTPQLLPKSMAVQAATQFNDTTLAAKDRIGSIASLILRTPDEGQQLAIYKQLVDAGVPEYTQGAVAAMARGDATGTQNLMRAVLIDPDKLAGQLPGSITGPQIDSAIQDRMFDEGAIGDIVYGVSDGSADNLNRVRADSTLINRDVKLHLIDGSAGGDLNKAIDMTIRDMYGDVQTVTGGGVKITLPKDTDPTPYRDGFEALQPQVRNALTADMQNGMVDVFGKDTDIRSTGMSQVIANGVDNAAQMVMANGYFINAGVDQYQFLNPYTGAVVADAKGAPLIFHKSDVLAAGAANPKSPGLPPVNYNATPDRMRSIYGSNFGRPLPFNPNGG